MSASFAIPSQEPVPDVTPRLTVRNVGLTLGGRVVLDDVGFGVMPGEIFGLLGPNGSGKTSLMRCLTGVLRPDLGVFWLNGRELNARSKALRAQVGVVFQEPSLDDRLTALENLTLAAALFGIRGEEALTRARELLVFMELAERGNDLVKTFSGGMKRRLEIARALIHRPDLLLMDEPTTGLDPHAFERLWQRLRKLRELQDLTIVLTTHRADEAALCDRLLVMDRGRVVEVDTPEGLLARVAGDILAIEAEAPEALAQDLEAQLGLRPKLQNDVVLVEGEELHKLVPRLVEAFPLGRFNSINIRRPTLADAFLSITGRPLGDLPGDSA